MSFMTSPSNFSFSFDKSVSFPTSFPTVIISSSNAAILSSFFSIISSSLPILLGALYSCFRILGSISCMLGAGGDTCSCSSTAAAETPRTGCVLLYDVSQSPAFVLRCSIVNAPSCTVATCVKPICSQNALSWLITTIAPSSSPHSDNASLNASTHSTSKWLETSSSKYRLLGFKANMANATRAFSPPLSALILRNDFSPLRPNPPMTVRASLSEMLMSPNEPSRAWAVTKSTARASNSNSWAKS
mmetsp:Transcript_22925/g.64942  ORF Transcript_22925/g.64942 Transcript_22925/m.64942 type:complete len:245 (+) Transcript_22925:234-968(+)